MKNYIVQWLGSDGYWPLCSTTAMTKEEAIDKSMVMFPLARREHVHARVVGEYATPSAQDMRDMFKKAMEK